MHRFPLDGNKSVFQRNKHLKSFFNYAYKRLYLLESNARNETEQNLVVRSFNGNIELIVIDLYNSEFFLYTYNDL